MTLRKKRIHDVIQRSHSALSRVNYHSYLASKKEPAEMISQMSPPKIAMQPSELLDSARQRRGIRKFAARLRLRNKS